MPNLGDQALGAAGFKSSWETAAADQAAAAQHDANARANQIWSRNQQENNNLSSGLASTNYNQAAQQQFQQQQANYNQMQTASGLLYNQATGNAPSMADLQMQAGLGQANNSVQSAMLSQQGGVSPGLSQRNMLAAQAGQNASIVSAGAANRAQELSTAQNNYSNLLGNMGQTAAGMTNQQRQFGQDTYGQQMANLGYQTEIQKQQFGQNTALSAADYAASMANVAGQSAANQAQYSAIGNDISGAANAATAWLNAYGDKK